MSLPPVPDKAPRAMLYLSSDDKIKYQDRIEKCERLLKNIDLTGKNFLDVGFGSGQMLLAAKKKGAAYCMGVEPFPWHMDRKYFEHFASESGIKTSEIDLIILPAEDVSGHDGLFDYAAIFDVLEHAPNLPGLFGSVYRMMRKGGVVVTSTAPLYYSPRGHHLGKVLDGDVDWIHLRPGFNETIKPTLSSKKREGFEALNKAKVSDIVKAAKGAGFTVTVQKTVKTDEGRLAALKHELQHHDLNDVDLLTEQLRLVLKKN